MQQEIRKKTKFIYFKIINQCAKDGRPEIEHSVLKSSNRIERRKQSGSLNLPSASKHRSRQG